MSGGRPCHQRGAGWEGQRSGQGVVELAVTLPVLLLLIFGLVALAQLMVAQIELTQAAWEGARAGATLRDPARGDAEIQGAVLGALRSLNPNALTIEIHPRQDQPPRNEPWPMPRGHPLAVRLRYAFSLNLPFSLTLPLEAQAVSRMEYQNE